MSTAHQVRYILPDGTTRRDIVRSVPSMAGRRSGTRPAVPNLRRTILYALFALTTLVTVLDLFLLVSSLPR